MGHSWPWSEHFLKLFMNHLGCKKMQLPKFNFAGFIFIEMFRPYKETRFLESIKKLRGMYLSKFKFVDFTVHHL